MVGFDCCDAFIWTEVTGMQSAGLGADSWAEGISQLGRIVGSLGALALTRYGGVVDTLPNPHRRQAIARGVNQCGNVVGTVSSKTVVRAVLWTKPQCDQ